MSVSSQWHVQFPRRHNSKSSVYSCGFSAKDTYYIAKVRQISPECGGFPAGALSYDDESDREGFQQARHEKYESDQSRYPQNSLYEIEYSPERLLDHYHPRTEYFMEDYPSNYKSRKASVYSNNRSLAQVLQFEGFLSVKLSSKYKILHQIL